METILFKSSFHFEADPELFISGILQYLSFLIWGNYRDTADLKLVNYAI